MGSKGSFWLVHEEIEKKVGFDVSYYRSVVEDQMSCLKFNSHGYNIEFNTACCEEISPFNLEDLVKQR